MAFFTLQTAPSLTERRQERGSWRHRPNVFSPAAIFKMPILAVIFVAHARTPPKLNGSRASPFGALECKDQVAVE